MDISCMHERTVCVGGTVCVGPSVEGLFWTVTAKQCIHTDPRQHYGSQHQSHNNFFCVCVCMCVCVCVQIASLFQSLFCLAYITMLWWIMYDRNLLRFHLNMRHQLQHDCGFLHVSCVSYCYHCVLVHYKNTKSCTFPSTLVDNCDLSYEVDLMAALPAQWLPAHSGSDKVEGNLISASLSNVLHREITTVLFIDVSAPHSFYLLTYSNSAYTTVLFHSITCETKSHYYRQKMW